MRPNYGILSIALVMLTLSLLIIGAGCSQNLTLSPQSNAQSTATAASALDFASLLQGRKARPVFKDGDQPTKDPAVIKIGSTYFLYYAADPSLNLDSWNISLATAPAIDGPWIKHGIVLSKGDRGTWESKWVADPFVIQDGSSYYLFYEGNTGSNSYIGYATSSDGYNWTKSSSNPIIRPGTGWERTNVGTPSVIKVGATWYLYYHGYGGRTNDRIGYATSANITGPYQKYGSNPVLSPGPAGWDSNWCGARSLFEYQSAFLMFYEGNHQIGVNGVQFGLAQSGDLSSWQKLETNPVLKLDDWSTFSLNEPRVYNDGSDYYLFFCSLPYNGIGRY